MTDETINLTGLSADIVAAYLTNNHLEPAEIGALITAVHSSLMGVGDKISEPENLVEKPSPAEIRNSVTSQGLVSFVDGKTYQTLKRHLTRHGFTPDRYRETFGLKPDYPMVSATYSARRSELAKAFGLGKARLGKRKRSK